MNMIPLNDLVDDRAPICYGILMPGHDTDGGCPVVKVRDYDHRGIDVSALIRVAPDIEAPYRRSRLEPGDILMSIRGTTGVLTVVPAELRGANITQDTARIRVDPAVAPYLLQALQSPFVQRQIRLQTIGQAVRGINIASVRALQIPWPVARERAKIASALRDLDDYIRTLHDLDAPKTRYRHGLAQQLLTGKKRFPEFCKSASRQRGEFGMLPADWHVERIADIASERSVRGAGDDAVVYSCTKHEGLVPSLEYFGKQVFSRDLSVYKRLEGGDFAYATNHIEEGSIGLLHAGMASGVVSPMYTVFRCGEAVNPEFLYAVLKTENYRRVFARRTSASVNRRGSLRWKEFSKIRVPVPSRAEQDRIVAVLELAKAELALLEQQRDLYTRYKRGLMARLLSGEIKVPA